MDFFDPPPLVKNTAGAWELSTNRSDLLPLWPSWPNPAGLAGSADAVCTARDRAGYKLVSAETWIEIGVAVDGKTAHLVMHGTVSDQYVSVGLMHPSLH